MLHVDDFDEFVAVIKTRGNLKDGTEISAGEKLMVFIDALKGMTNRELKLTWNHSGNTLSNIIHDVCEAILTIETLGKQPPTADYFSRHIKDNPKFLPYFDDCIGALDGSHLPTIVENALPDIRQGCMGRKGRTQNILACASFELFFTYCVVGWEGSARPHLT